MVHHGMYVFYLVRNPTLLITNAASPIFNEEMIFRQLRIVHKWCTAAQRMVYCVVLHTITRYRQMHALFLIRYHQPHFFPTPSRRLGRKKASGEGRRRLE